MADSTTSIFALTKPEVNVSTTWPTSLNADLDSLDDLLARPKQTFNSPVVGATTTCDLSLARVFVFTVSQATTLAFSNVPSSSFAVRVLLLVTNGNAFVLTYPASIVWLEGSAPTLKTSGVDVLELVTRDGGTTWYAQPLYRRNPIPDTTQTDSAAGSPVNLKSYVVPAGMLATDGQGLHVRAWGYTANNANAKAVRVSFGTLSNFSQSLQASIQEYWHFDILIYRVSATTANVVVLGKSTGTFKDAMITGGGAGIVTVSNFGTLTNTIQFSCTQTSAADLSQVALVVERIGL